MAGIAEYRQQMLQRKAARAGLPLDEFLARGEAEYARICAINQARTNVALQRAAITRRATAHGRTFVVLAARQDLAGATPRPVNTM